MISINSTEEERFFELSKQALTVVPWNQEKALTITDPNETISHALMRYAKENGIIGSAVSVLGFNHPIKITTKTIKESISSMCRQQADLYNLGKLLTNIDEITKNSKVLQVEPFRHADKRKKDLVIANHQYISAFCDEEYLYPVKITIEERFTETANNIHMTITIGTIDLKSVEKEGITIPRVHPFKDGESADAGRMPSFKISIPQLLSFFNNRQSILIKNFPDAMLSEKQLYIKQKVLEADMKKELLADGTIMTLQNFVKELEDAFQNISKAFAIGADTELSLLDKDNTIYKAVKEDLLKKQEEKPFFYELATKISLEDMVTFKEIVKENPAYQNYVIETEVFQYEEYADIFKYEKYLSSFCSMIKNSVSEHKQNREYHFEDYLPDCFVSFQTFLSEEGSENSKISKMELD